MLFVYVCAGFSKGACGCHCSCLSFAFFLLFFSFLAFLEEHSLQQGVGLCWIVPFYDTRYVILVSSFALLQNLPS